MLYYTELTKMQTYYDMGNDNVFMVKNRVCAVKNTVSERSSSGLQTDQDIKIDQVSTASRNAAISPRVNPISVNSVIKMKRRNRACR